MYNKKKFNKQFNKNKNCFNICKNFKLTAGCFFIPFHEKPVDGKWLTGLSSELYLNCWHYQNKKINK